MTTTIAFRTLACACPCVLAVAASLAACSGTVLQQDLADSGPVDSGATPDGAPTSGTDAGDGSAPDAADAPTSGKQLATGGDLELWGVTSDGFAVYGDLTAHVLYAVSLAGGPPKALLTGWSPASDASDQTYQTHWVSVQGKVVFAWPDAQSPTLVTPLYAWTSSLPAPVQLTATSAETAYSWGPWVSAYASPDSTHVLYTSNATRIGSNTTTFDVYLAGVDGSNPVNLFPAGGLPIEAFQAAFAGPDAVVVSTIRDNITQGPVDVYGVEAFTVPGGAATALFSKAAGPYAIDDAQGGQVLVQSTQGLDLFGLSGLSTGTVATVSIDANGAFGRIASSGQQVIYTTQSGDLEIKQIALTQGMEPTSLFLTSGIAPTTLPVNGRPGPAFVLAPNDQSVLAFTGGPLVWVSTVTPGDTLSLLPTSAICEGGENNCFPFDSYTSDSAHVMYPPFASEDGTLDAFSVAAGGSVQPDGGVVPTVVSRAQLAQWAAAPSASSKVVVATTTGPTASGLLQGQLLVVDTASSAAPKVLTSAWSTAASSGTAFALTEGSVVYTTLQGLFVSPIL